MKILRSETIPGMDDHYRPHAGDCWVQIAKARATETEVTADISIFGIGGGAGERVIATFAKSYPAYSGQ